MDSIKKTKIKLSFIFSSILIVIFLGLLVGYFSFKYFSEVKVLVNEKDNIQKIIKSEEGEIVRFVEEYNTIGDDAVKYDEVEKVFDFIDALATNENAKFNEDTGDAISNVAGDFEFFNKKIIILDLDKEFKYSNIEDYKKINTSKYLEDDLKNEYKEQKLDIVKYKMTDYYILVFFPKNYLISFYIRDILYSVFGSLVFFILLYIIFYIFVGRTLKPVNENIDNMKEFIDNAGHELKTPLAVIDSSLWLFDETKKYDKKLLDKTRVELEKANNLIETLRDLSSITKSSKKEKFMALEVIKGIVLNYKDKILEKKIKVYLSDKNDIKVISNKDYFYILISNIISNAIKYNKKNGTIKIVLNSDSIIIEDSGVGISKKNLTKVFERFFRVKEQRKVEGHGLGLSLVNKIVKINGWKIEVESEEGKGSRVVLRVR